MRLCGLLTIAVCISCGTLATAAEYSSKIPYQIQHNNFETCTAGYWECPDGDHCCADGTTCCGSDNKCYQYDCGSHCSDSPCSRESTIGRDSDLASNDASGPVCHCTCLGSDEKYSWHVSECSKCGTEGKCKKKCDDNFVSKCGAGVTATVWSPLTLLGASLMAFLAFLHD
eukprot:gb/GECG01005002.1/.p1 GENE.gb/GECG01005002.1/~~gb/GECG01005002.1/.p1  ORF type:complete len:171 (+),score=12.92 gb/GECG01005002.1/:1-513(+)